MTTVQWIGVFIIALLCIPLFMPSKNKVKAQNKKRIKDQKKKNIKQSKKSDQTNTSNTKKNPVEKFISSLKSENKDTVQDLLQYEHIYDNGMVKLKQGTYTAVIEVKQINNRLNNIEEKTSVWQNYRDFINAVNIRQTQLVQSHYLDISDFIQEYEDTSSSLAYLTPELINAREDVLQNYQSYSERKTREYRSYIIFRFNPAKEGGEAGLRTGNGAIDTLMKSLREQTHQMTKEEEEDLSRAILDEMCDLSYQMLSNVGIESTRLTREGVLNMVYMTLNRDLSVIQRLQDASNARSFTEFKQSLTPFMAEELIKQEAEASKPLVSVVSEPAVQDEPIEPAEKAERNKAILEEMLLTETMVENAVSEEDEYVFEMKSEIETVHASAFDFSEDPSQVIKDSSFGLLEESESEQEEFDLAASPPEVVEENDPGEELIDLTGIENNEITEQEDLVFDLSAKTERESEDKAADEDLVFNLQHT